MGSLSNAAPGTRGIGRHGRQIIWHLSASTHLAKASFAGCSRIAFLVRTEFDGPNVWTGLKVTIARLQAFLQRPIPQPFSLCASDAFYEPVLVRRWESSRFRRVFQAYFSLTRNIAARFLTVYGRGDFDDPLDPGEIAVSVARKTADSGHLRDDRRLSEPNLEKRSPHRG